MLKSQQWNSRTKNSYHGQTHNIKVRAEEVVLKLGVDETFGKDRLQGQKQGRSGINWQAETVRQLRACSSG